MTIRFVSCGSMVVSSIADAKKALGRTWENKEAPAYLDAVRLVDDAIAGICRPEVAFQAFTLVAARQGMLKKRRPSAALTMFDNLWSANSSPPY